PNDRSTRALIGDGAGAFVLQAGNDDDIGAILHFDLGSDGEQVDLLHVPSVKRAHRKTGASDSSYFKMQGKAVFTQAVTHMTESVLRVVEKTKWKLDEVDQLVPHQANARILAAVAEQLNFSSEKVCSNIGDVGNTVAASIPLALADACNKGALKRGNKVVLTAFGAGLTWGSISLVWPDIQQPKTGS
ncbi:MAG: 3-oxoacyl-[acyl-carrier-protein] synthase III C-terminal domain-containing protein, partial [Myxococcota bacterium]